MQDCIFEKIIKREIPSEIVYEDNETLAFLDINPRAPGHTIVISKTHAPNLIDLPKEKVPSLFLTVKTVTGIIQKALKPDGFTIGINHGQVSGQTIDHLHVHIIPRFNGDGGRSIHSVVNNPPSESLASIAARIRAVNSKK